MLKSACVNKPFKSFKNLKTGSYYVQGFQRAHTSYGDRIRVELFDCFVYLPTRFSKILNNKDVSELNECIDVVMTYTGRDSDSQDRLLLDFDVVRLDVDGDVF